MPKEKNNFDMKAAYYRGKKRMLNNNFYNGGRINIFKR